MHLDCWPRRLPKNAGFGTGKQHGRAQGHRFLARECVFSMSNVASRTYKKERVLQLWGSFRTSNWLWDAPRLLTEKASQKRWLRNGETAWPGELKDTVFWSENAWSSMSNVASRTYKKERVLQLWGSFRTSNCLWDAPRLLTEKASHKRWLRNGETAWPGELKHTVYVKPRVQNLKKREGFAALGFNSHLELAWRRTSTSDRKGFPFDLSMRDLQCQTSRPKPKKERVLQLWGSFRTSNWLWDAPRLLTEKASQKRWLRNGETAWPGELKDTVFWPENACFQCQTSRPEPIKKRGFCSFGAHFAPRIAFEMHLDFWPKRLPKNAGFGTGKQHGLASSRTPFFDLRMRDLQCQTSRPEPIKKRGFCSLGVTPGKTRLYRPKCFPKASLRNGGTAWPGELRDTVFSPAIAWSSIRKCLSYDENHLWARSPW